MPTKLWMKPAGIPLQCGGARAEAPAIAAAAAASRCQPSRSLHPHLKASPPSAARCLSAAMASISCFCSAYAPWCRSRGRSLPACRENRARKVLGAALAAGPRRQMMLADGRLIAARRADEEAAGCPANHVRRRRAARGASAAPSRLGAPQRDPWHNVCPCVCVHAAEPWPLTVGRTSSTRRLAQATAATRGAGLGPQAPRCQCRALPPALSPPRPPPPFGRPPARG